MKNNIYNIIFSLLISVLIVVNADADFTKLIDNGDSNTKIDLTFIGSGFTSAEICDYISKVDQNISKMNTVNWFAIPSNATLLNVWRVDAISPTSGIDLAEAEINSQAQVTPYDVLIIIHNYNDQEGVRYPNIVDLYIYSHNYVVIAHELGHIIGKLDDEYYNSHVAWKCDGLSKRTINVHDKPSNEKWSDYISTQPYEGARFCEFGLWRPTENSIMRDSANTPAFNALGLKAMDIGAGKILGTIETNQPNLEIIGLNNNDIKSGVLEVAAIATDDSGIERIEFYWAKAGDTSKSIKIDKTEPYAVSIDTTRFVDGEYFLDTLAYDTNWNYTRVTRRFEVNNLHARVSQANPPKLIKVYPNPAKAKVLFQFAGEQSSEIEISIFNIAGELVSKITSDFVSEQPIIEWNVSGLVKSIYMYKIYYNKQVGESGKIMVSH